MSGRPLHRLAATPATVHWGHFDSRLAPVLHVRSGDRVAVETITHHAGDAADLLMDDGVAAVFAGVTDRGPGPHILTGPIFVEDARPGDTLSVRILELAPRLRYGSNLAAHWGALHNDTGKERVTVYELDTSAGTASARFAFDWTATRRAAEIGLVLEVEPDHREPALGGVRVPLRPHFGVIGVAPPGAERVDSVPPGAFGGNVDNWRFGPGATIHYPVFHEGALLSIGDPHAAEGDGELSGTALEASLNGVVEVSVRRDMVVRNPVAETATHWITHGFGPDLDTALHEAATEMLRLLDRLAGLSRDDAYSLMSTAVDFGVTQVVNQRPGVHALLPRSVLP